MIKLRIFSTTLVLAAAFLLQGCLQEKYNDYLESLSRDSTNLDKPALIDLKFPADFNFVTETIVSVNITDNSPNVVYEAYAYSDELINSLDSIIGPLPNKLFEKQPLNGSILESVNLSTFIEDIFLVRKSNESVNEVIVPIIQNSASYSYNGNSGKRAPSKANSQKQSNTDCANIYGQRFYADVSSVSIGNTGDVNTISNIQFPKQGVTAIVMATPVNGAEFKNRFSIAGGGFSTPIFTFNGFNFWIRSKIDTNNDPDGYVEFEMTFDTPVQNLLMHFRSVDASMYQFVGDQHTETLLSGGSEFVYDDTERILRDTDPRSKARYYRDGYGTLLISAASGTFNRIVWRRVDDPNTNGQNDTNWFTFSEVEICNDEDRDGVEDSVDEYPNDATRAYAITYPSSSTKASLIFEDLWPFKGDWDFNDTALDYSITRIFNARNEMVGIDFDYVVTSDGAGFVNSFAFEIEGLSPNNVGSISGQILDRDVFSLAGNGTELGQQHAVIPLFDDHSILVNQENKVSVLFVNPLVATSLDYAPYNPFLVANGERDKEIHLANYKSTTLGNSQPEVTGNNSDVDGDYTTENGLPWAINVIESFPLLLEKEPLNEGYLFFEEWGVSGGKSKKDWYKDIPGYRNVTKLRSN
ncbi:LruC domain-containing protein [Flagellimonas allohymeniacidonis]|uniref:LruC domain-containing protein n=1 Tax=Flagellimonas allohymeniacidonis TaxID=2517819 RepID=A0A4Q8QI58_9FLAO|nr:LruC domain-containing protein [Allomuricauda hymeniacidonis]TAI49517.1 LruC domain-containing protein [Allomuricauda hymeniacidonis]